MVFKKLENENESQYIYRIGQAKDNGLINDTWDNIAIKINTELGKPENEWKGESVYRKKYLNFKEARDNHVFDVPTNQQIDELKNTINEIREEKIKIQTLNIERNRYDREESRQALFYEYVGSQINSLPLPEFKPLYRLNENNKVNYLVCIADIHYGASFVSRNNEYSPEIFKERLSFLATYLLEFINRKKIDTITIAELGDTIQGILRISDLKLNDSSVVKAVVEISRLLAEFLNELSKYVNIEYYHVGTSNHSQIRPLGTKANQFVDEDLEYVIGNYISDLLKNNFRVNVHLVNNGEHFIEIKGLGYKVIAAHGHQFNNLETAVRDMSMSLGEFVDYLVVGHYHNAKNVDIAEGCTYNMELLCCPSFVGSDPYADSLMKGSKAATVVYGFDEIYGHTETYKFILN